MGRFEDIASEVVGDTTSTIKSTTFASEDVTPDQESEVVQLANKFKTNPEFVRPSLGDFKKKAEAPSDEEYEVFVNTAPKSSTWMAKDPSHTILNKDNIKQLNAIEDTVNEYGFLAKTYKSINAGTAEALSGILKFPKLAYDVAAKPLNPLIEKMGYAPLKSEDYFKGSVLNKGIELFDQIAELESNAVADLGKSTLDEAQKGNYAQAGKSVYYSVLRSAPNTVVAIMSTMAGNPSYGLGSIFASASGNKYQENLKLQKEREAQAMGREVSVEGGSAPLPNEAKTMEQLAPQISDNEAILNAVGSGAIEVVTEKLFGAFNGLKKAMKPMVSVLTKEAGVESTKQIMKETLKTMASSAAEEGFEEVLASGSNDFADWMLDINPNALEMKGFVKRMIESGVVGAASGGALTTPAALGLAYKQKRQLKEAELNRDTLLAIGPKFNDSKLKERLPEKHREYVEAVTKDGPLENVYVPLTKFDAYFQTKEQDPAQAAAEMGISKLYDEAKVTGDLVKVPIANWAERVVGTEVEKGLADDAKFSPDSLTVNEAKEERSKAAEQLGEIVVREEAAKTAETETRTIQKDLEQKLVASGAYSPTDAKAMALTLAQPYRTRAESLGVTPQELYQKEGLKVFGYESLPEGVQGLEQADKLAPPFFYKSQQLLNEKMGNSATVEQVNGVLKEIKPEERKWLGIDNFLKGKTKVSKAELLDYLKANELQIEEVVKGVPKELPQGYKVEKTESITMPFRVTDTDEGRVTYATGVSAEEAIAVFNGRHDKTKYSQYTLPAGENYREVLFRMPEKSRDSPYGAAMRALANEVMARMGRDNFSWATDLTPDEFERHKEIQKLSTSSKKASEAANYTSSHWDESNVLAFTRLNDRIDADGKRVLFVEEIQSDWHQEGRKKGYRNEASKITELPEGYKVTTYKGAFNVQSPEGRVMLSGVDSKEEAIKQTIDKINREAVTDKVPDAPLRKTWHEFVMKRLIREAAEKGYDKIAWTTGEQQAERYDLSKQIQAIRVEKNKDDTYFITFQKLGEKDFETDNSLNVPKDKLDEYIGKDLAAKVDEKKKSQTFKGLDLKVGGEGMKGFYDKILVDFANKFGKKYGAKVEDAGLTNAKKNGQRRYDIVERDDGVFEVFDNVLDKTISTDHKTVEQARAARPEVETVKVHSLTITPALKDAALGEGFALFQADKQKNVRGFFDPVARLVGLIKGKANLSTMLHEGGHVFLEQMSQDFDYLKEQPELNQKQVDYLARMETALEFLEVESFKDIKTEHHEKWARSFEAYLMEGKAPSKRLEAAFDKFKIWLLDIYKSIRGLNVELTPEIRDVFDRLLATEEEIAKAQSNYTPLFKDPVAAGMGKDLASKWYNTSSEAVEAASSIVREPVMNDYKKKQEKLYRDEARKVRAEIADGLDKLPDQKALKAIETDPMVKDLPIEIQAEMYGYDSVAEFETAMDQARRQREYVDTAVEAEMNKRYPDSLFDLEESAVEAVHNDKQAEKLRIEAEFLASKMNDKQVAAKLIARLPNSKILKEEAARRIGEKNVKDIKPYIFERAERAAAKEAAQAFKQLEGKSVEETETLLQQAFEAKRKELLNHEMFKAAIEAQRTVEKKVKDYKKLFKKNEDLAKYRDIDYVNAARAVAANYGITKAEKTAEEYLDKLRKYEPARYAGLMNIINSASDGAGPYKEVSFNKFESMTRAVDALWNLSKSTEMQTIEGEKIEREQVITELSTGSELVRSKKGFKDGFDSTKKDHGAFATFGLKLKAALTRIEAFVDYMDGGKIDGPFRKYLWNPILQANVNYDLKKNETLKAFRDALRDYAKDAPNVEIPAKELIGLDGRAFVFQNKFELLMAVLHTGNDSNKSKLLRGYGWGLEIDGVLDTSKWDAFQARMIQEGVLTKKDFDFAQTVWNQMESFKPDLQKTHKELEGYFFEEVTAKSFDVVLPDGSKETYQGGYVPAKVDRNKVKDFQKLDEIDLFEKNNPSFSFPTTGSGATKTRNEAFARRLSLDLNLLGAHMDWALRYTYLEPRAQEVSRLINDQKMKDLLQEIDPEIKGALESWLQRTAQQTIVVPSTNTFIRSLEPAAKYFRTSAAMQVMFGNVSNTLQQATGLVVAMTKVKPKYIAQGFTTWLTGFGRESNKAVEDMIAKSDYMNTIQGINVYEVQNAITDIIANPTKYEAAQEWALKHTYILQTAAQNIVNTSVWWGAYNQAVGEKMSEKQAVMAADSAVRQTQGTNKAIDVAAFEVGSPVFRTFIQFAGYFNMLANLNAAEAGKIINEVGIRKGGGRLFAVYLTGFMLPAVLSEMIVKAMGGQGLDEDDDDEYLDDFLAMFAGSQFKTATAMVPAVGSFLTVKYNRAFTDNLYDDRLNMNLAISTWDQVTDFPTNLYKDVKDGSVDAGKQAKDFLMFLGVMTKTPVGLPAKQVKYLIDVSEGKVEPTGPIDFTRGLITGKGKRE